MNASDLRIGNYVSPRYSSGGIFKIESLNWIDVTLHGWKNEKYNNLEGVDLSEIWLSKLGFTYNSDKSYSISSSGAGEVKVKPDGEQFEIYFDDHYLFTRLLSVHSLQNLVYELIFKELTLKEN